MLGTGAFTGDAERGGGRGTTLVLALVGVFHKVGYIRAGWVVGGEVCGDEDVGCKVREGVSGHVCEFLFTGCGGSYGVVGYRVGRTGGSNDTVED
jgi:hypothetical protein